jgi:Fanconi-associated nuclease 1
MPDLLLWRPCDRRAKVVEVKGPRDRLSEQQRAWLHALAQAEVEVEVLKVLEPGGRR